MNGANITGSTLIGVKLLLCILLIRDKSLSLFWLTANLTTASRLHYIFSKKNLRKLCKSFYFCLLKLFKFNFYNKSEQYINDSLEPFGLRSFQYSFITKILLFIAKIGTIKAAPIVLKKQINLNHNLRSNRALRVEIKRRFRLVQN